MGQAPERCWTDPKVLEAEIEDYFASLNTEIIVGTDKDGLPITKPHQRPPTMAGLAHHLGVVRQTLLNYDKRDEFVPVLTRAKNRIAMMIEEALYIREMSNGARFALEVNHNYGREATTESDGTFEMQVISPPAAPVKAIARWEDKE